ncbi:MAG: CDP-alcohol phosphatidyltransferase family protein [Candidatus Hodarchaeota archaeon]
MILLLSSLPNKRENVDDVMSFDDYMRQFFISHGQKDRIEEVLKSAKKDPFGMWYSPVVYKGAKILGKLGFTPNKISLMNLVLSFFIFYLTMIVGDSHMLAPYSAQPTLGWIMFPLGFLVLFTGWLDGMDGAVATLFNQKSKKGGWFDAIIDRICDVIVLVCLIPPGFVYVPDVGLDFSWLIWTNVILIFIYEYMRAKHYEVGLTRSQAFMGERVTRVLVQWQFYMVYGGNAIIGAIINLVNPISSPADNPFPLYRLEIYWLMSLFLLVLLVIMSISIILSAKWIWTELKKMDEGKEKE